MVIKLMVKARSLIGSEAHSLDLIGLGSYPIIINYENLSKHKIKAARI